MTDVGRETVELAGIDYELRAAGGFDRREREQLFAAKRVIESQLRTIVGLAIPDLPREVLKALSLSELLEVGTRFDAFTAREIAALQFAIAARRG